jgi:hypothetical protein
MVKEKISFWKGLIQKAEDEIIKVVLTFIILGVLSGLFAWGIKYIEAFPMLKKSVPVMQQQLKADSSLISELRREINWLEDQKTNDSIEKATWRRAMEIKTTKIEKSIN